MPKKLWRHRLLIPLCALLVESAALVQFSLVLDVELRLPIFVIPAVVGASFGVLLVRILDLRDQQRQHLSELEAQRSEIDELNAGLSKLVEERTSELQETQKHLYQAQKMEAIGRLAGGVAHDFNNLLTAIIGGTSLALLKTPGTAEQKLLRDVLQAAERGAGLTRQLLAFGRPSAKEARVLDLNQVLEEMIPMLRMILGETPIDWLPGEGVPPVEADPGQLGQVIMNLVVNARDAMVDGGVVVVGTKKATQEGQDRALLLVKDTGAGMDQETQDQVLEPFFSTKPQGGGTGLGLAVAYGIVSQAKGELRISSEVGVGTEVTVDLPATEKPLEVRGNEPSVSRVSGTGETVLVVDDDELVRLVVSRGLMAGGYKVLSTGDGNAALAKLEEVGGRVDLLLCDVCLAAGESGYDVAQKVLEREPGVAVVFMSGYLGSELGQQQVTDEPLLSKPFEVAPLLDACRKALRNRSLARADKTAG